MRKTIVSEEVYNVLGIGVEHAKKRGEITGLTGYNAREIRLAVNDLRGNGYPICSGDEGYWIAKNAEEVDRTIRRLLSEARNIQEVINCLEVSKETL